MVSYFPRVATEGTYVSFCKFAVSSIKNLISSIDKADPGDLKINKSDFIVCGLKKTLQFHLRAYFTYTLT